ncbi:MAG: hypothetical protein C4524_03540 [Candidatus Zixiibacteriota bacterium]|nr:MAG: hypothetical protein C4524_03540 [candidate division Zixibacteria bacterium]
MAFMPPGTRNTGPMLLYFILFISLLVPGTAGSQQQYDQYDWVSYADFHQVTDVTLGREEAYIATTGGVLRWNLYRQSWEEPWVVVRGRTEAVDLRDALNVDYITETNSVAVATAHGTYLYNPTAEYWEPGEHNFDLAVQGSIPGAIFLDPPGPLVSGRNYFQQGNNVIMDSQLRQHGLGPSATDDWGYQWVGVQGVGILRLDTRLLRGTLWELGLYGADVRDVIRGEGWTVLAGHNRNQGITFWKQGQMIWDHLEARYTAGLESVWINDLAVTGKWLLAATDAGLAQIDLKNGTSRMYTLFQGLWSNRSTAVAADEDTVWIGTENGLSVLDLAKKEVKRITTPDLANRGVYTLAVDPEALWIGGEAGLYRLDRATGTGGWLEPEGGVAGPVYDLQVTPGEVIAGRFGGLEIIRKADLEMAGFPAEAFLAGSSIQAVLALDSLVWVGTDRGLWKLDRPRNRWHQYTTRDGLISDEVTALYPDGDHLLIGTPEGVTRFFWNDPTRGD